jgi:hypothetical protein
MTDYADLEIGLQGHQDEGTYRIEPRLRLPRSQGITEPPGDQDLRVAFDLEALSSLERDLDYDGYGRLLTQSLFAPGPVREFLSQARAATQAQGRSLRLRLRIGGGATGAVRPALGAAPRSPATGRAAGRQRAGRLFPLPGQP